LPFAIVSIFLAASTPADPDPTETSEFCDPRLQTDDETPLGYRDRGDRCEGLYVQPVSSSVLQIASFARSISMPATAGRVPIRWRPPVASRASIRVVDLRRRLYYRMDTTRPAGATSFDWDLEVVSPLRLGSDELGVLVWSNRRIGPSLEKVHLGAQVGEDAGEGKKASYELILLVGAELTQIFLTVAPVATSGEEGHPLQDAATEGEGWYPAGMTLRLPIDVPHDASGIYLVEIAARMRQGEGVTRRLWFEHVAE
jgi:hypothetical protein